MSPDIELFPTNNISNHPADICIRVFYLDETKAEPKEQVQYAHKAVLSKSPYFHELITKNCEATVIKLDLSHIKDALNAFKVLLAFLYRADSVLTGLGQANAESLIHLARLCKMPALETQVNMHHRAAFFSQVLATLNTPTTAAHTVDMPAFQTLCTAYMQMQSLLQAQQNQNLWTKLITSTNSGVFPNHSYLPTTTANVFPLLTATSLPGLPIQHHPRYSEPRNSLDDLNSGERSPARSDTSASSSPATHASDSQLVPSNDKEGWCRNKKYIETVPTGYRCSVCRKIYGRYNSVSYHVTIYHRNPPIKCDEEGCPFTTREARYIHFHKYYRHQIPLPPSIDLASRKCMFCRHISKSPAMLDKHINRHVADCTKNGHRYDCPLCQFSTNDQRVMFEHLRDHQIPKGSMNDNVVENSCTICDFRGSNETELQHHVLFKHNILFNQEDLPSSSNVAETSSLCSDEKIDVDSLDEVQECEETSLSQASLSDELTQ
uniref:BTB domain-containing protein n=1 Tax=Acrobeloides nanus TaxID=290746 RepID=A0A914DMC8_9BILA